MAEDNVLKKLLIRFGGLAFAFFFIKGLVWLAIFWFGWESFNHFFGQA
tara:strand:+ start:484 stop:627 length:144 start_codon:yes stop_codon:yes gene_type:complete